MPNPTDIRLAVASQPTVEQSIDALLRVVTGRIGAPVTDTGPDSAHALAVDMDANPKAWSDAVLANTPLAPLSASTALPIPVSGNMEDTKATVEAQPSVAQGVAAFIRHASHHIHKLHDGEDVGAKSLAADISNDPRSWKDAMLANTPPVPSPTDIAPVPAYVAPEFKTFGTEAGDETSDAPKPSRRRKTGDDASGG